MCMYISLTISSCYGSIPLTLGLIGRDGGVSTLYHSCGFACQQRVLKTYINWQVRFRTMQHFVYSFRYTF